MKVIGIAATRDVSTLEGLKGAKIVPCAALTTPIIEAMVAVPVQMPVTEMHTGRITGTIDGAYATCNDMTPTWIFRDVATHLVPNVPIQNAVIFVVMNRERHDGLSDVHRGIIDELAGEAASISDPSLNEGA